MALLADQFGYGPALWASVAVLVLTVLLSLLASPWLLRHQQSDSEWRWPLLQERGGGCRRLAAGAGMALVRVAKAPARCCSA